MADTLEIMKKSASFNDDIVYEVDGYTIGVSKSDKEKYEKVNGPLTENFIDSILGCYVGDYRIKESTANALVNDLIVCSYENFVPATKEQIEELENLLNDL